MSEVAFAHSLMGGIPLVVLLILTVLIYRRKGPHPATYELSQEWTHAPILWAADEPADHDHGGHDSHPTVGGGASGRW